MSNLQPNCSSKIDFEKVDQHAGGKWLIHDIKRSWSFNPFYITVSYLYVFSELITGMGPFELFVYIYIYIYIYITTDRVIQKIDW